MRSGDDLMKLSIVPRYALLFAAMLALLGAGETLADTAILGSAKDNTLIEDAGGLVSNGAGRYLFAGTQGFGLIRRGVIAFDTGSIPAGSTVTGARLTLYMNMTIFGDVPVSVHRLTADWGEGTSIGGMGEGGGAPSTPNDATWIHTFYDGSFWSMAGGDFVGAASATTTVGPLPEAFYDWSSQGMIDDVQAWVDNPASNDGWILIGDETQATTAKRFAARENLDPLLRPVLTVDYTPPPPGPGSVPDRQSAGTPVRLTKGAGGALGLSWGGSCSAGGVDYEVYEGTLGSFASHVPALCSTSGSTTATITPAVLRGYYLVVPRTATDEGSYGKRTGGIERPPSAFACFPQRLTACP